MTASEEIRRHTILLRVENRSGVLAKIAGSELLAERTSGPLLTS